MSMLLKEFQRKGRWQRGGIRHTGDDILIRLAADKTINHNANQANLSKNLMYRLHDKSYQANWIPKNKYRESGVNHMRDLAVIQDYSGQKAQLTYETLWNRTNTYTYAPDSEKDYSGPRYEENVTGERHWLDIAFDRMKGNSKADRRFYDMLSENVLNATIPKPTPLTRIVIK